MYTRNRLSGYRLLSEVSHSTKGVVLLMCDGSAAKRVMDEAQKLNMVQGNFVWLWIDTSASITAKNDSKLSIFYPPAAPYEEGSRGKDRRIRESSGDDRATHQDHISYILKYLVGDRFVKNNSTTNSSFADSVKNNSGMFFSTSKGSSFNSTLLDNNTSDTMMVNVNSVTENNSNFSENIYKNIEDNNNISSSSKANSQVRETGGENTLNKSLKIVTSSLEASISHSTRKNNTSSLDEYIWIPSKRIFWNGESLPKNNFLDLVQNLQLPLNVMESANMSVFIERLVSTKSNNNSDNRLNKRKKVTRAVKTKANENSAREQKGVPPLPVGVLGIRALPLRFDRHLVRSAVRLLVEAVRRTLYRKCHQDLRNYSSLSCWDSSPEWQTNFSQQLVR